MSITELRLPWLERLYARLIQASDFTKFWLLILALNGWRFFLGETVRIRLHDTFDSEWPRYVEQARTLLEYGPQSWFPTVAAGIPAHAAHFSVLHPLVLIHTVLPPWLAFDFVMALNGFVAGYGLFRLLKVNLGVDRDKAFLLGCVYCVFAQLNILVELPFEYAFPLIISLLYAPGRRVWLSALAVALLGATSYPVLNGAPFLVWHFVLFMLMWTRGTVTFWRGVIIGAIFWIGYCLTFVPNLVALLDYLPYSIRDYTPPQFASLGAMLSYYPKAVASVAADQMLVFAIPAALIGALCAARFDRILTIAALLVGGATLLCGFLNSDLYALLQGTFFRKMDLYHVVRTLPQLYWILLGVALDRTMLNGPRALRYALGAVAAIVFAALVVPYDPVPYIAPALMMAAAAALACAKHWDVSLPKLRPAETLATILAIAVVVSGVYFVEKDNRRRYSSIYGDDSVYGVWRQENKREPFRILVAGYSSSSPQMAGVETIDGHAAIFDRSFRNLLSFAATKRSPDASFWTNWHDLNLTDLIGYPFDSTAIRLPVLAAMNVRYILAEKPIAGLPVAPITQGPNSRADKFTIHAVPDSLPRGHFVSVAKLAKDKDDAATMLGALPERDWLTTVVVTSENGAPLQLPAPQQSCGTAAVQTYEPDRLIFRLTAAADCVFVVANNYNHNWRARIDGADTAIHRANLAFQAVVVPRGARELALRFQPPLFPWILALVPAGAFVMFCAVAFAGRLRQGKVQ